MGVFICEKHGRSPGRMTCEHVADAVERDVALEHVVQIDESGSPCVICMQCKAKVDAYFADRNNENAKYTLSDILNGVDFICAYDVREWEESHNRA